MMPQANAAIFFRMYASFAQLQCHNVTDRQTDVNDGTISRCAFWRMLTCAGFGHLVLVYL